MANYTITIKTLIKNGFDFKMTDYPIFDENYRSVLNTKILDHYYENEIGFETETLFRKFLNTKLNEIMPFYNELYKAQKEIIDKNLLLNNVNITEDFKANSNTATNSSSSSTDDSKNLYQDTPQGKIFQNDIDSQNFATSVTFNKINDKSSTEGTAKNTNDYIKKIIGNNGGKFNIDILQDLKNKLLNIDMLIINDLEDLFIQIF